MWTLNRRTRRLVLIAAVVILSWIAREWSQRGGQGGPLPSTSQIEQLHAQGISDRVVDVDGIVDRVLKDDLEGSRHQRFVLRLPSGHTVLVAHNIDLSERVPLARGDRVEARGEYEWNERGGVLHWTHRDPQGRHEDGWIRHSGRRYD